jgi:hypothetical protein
MRTEFGSISASLLATAPNRLTIHIEGTATPPKGIELCSPLARQIQSARIDGRDATVDAQNRIKLESLPATVELSY